MCDWLRCLSVGRWAMLGIYPLAGAPTMLLGSPVFESVTIHTAGGGTLQLVAHGASPRNVYVSGCALNGANLTDPSKPLLDYGALVLPSSKLECWMQDSPGSSR